jgi:hypothetical protein
MAAIVEWGLRWFKTIRDRANVARAAFRNRRQQCSLAPVERARWCWTSLWAGPSGGFWESVTALYGHAVLGRRGRPTKRFAGDRIIEFGRTDPMASSSWSAHLRPPIRRRVSSCTLDREGRTDWAEASSSAQRSCWTSTGGCSKGLPALRQPHVGPALSVRPVRRVHYCEHPGQRTARQ